MFKKMSIKAKMLFGILPIVIISMVLMTFIAATSSRTAIMDQVNETAESKLDGNAASLGTELKKIESTTLNIASTAAGTYKNTSLRIYNQIFDNIIRSNDSIIGVGLWFEPNVYDPNQTYEGPYWYRKDNGGVGYSTQYMTEEYNYFEREYYQNAKNMTDLGTAFTDPYLDETSGLTMITCSAPILGASGEFVGCVSVDVSMDQIEAIMAEVKMGKTGKAVLTTQDGTYIYAEDASKAENQENVTADSNAAYAKAAAKAIAGDKGSVAFAKGGKDYTLFYDTLEDVNWKMLIQMETAEMTTATTALTTRMLIVLVIAIVAVVLAVLALVRNISKSLHKVRTFAGALAKGDFTVNKLGSRKTDELGQMSASLDNMYESNRDVIGHISDESKRINEASHNLSSMAEELNSQFELIRTNMSGVNDAMMASGAATEEVNASVEEVNASVQALAGEAERSSEEAEQITRRAQDIERSSQQAYDNAIAIVEARSAELEEANRKSEIVNEIGNLAGTIAEIADQINLLSLNASIEAASAGEHGRGFAEVASEINKLASDTGEAVGQIQETIEGVQDAFRGLSASANELLQFMRDTVTPDYNNFVGIGRQYGEDAQLFGNQTQHIADLIENIRAAMDEVSHAIESIAESTQETASHSSDVNESVNTVSGVVEGVTDMSTKQGTIAESLSGIVGKFKLD